MTYLSFEYNSGGTFTFVPNAIEFLDMDLSENPNGVTDFIYDLKVDSDGFGGYDIFRSGNVSDVLAQTTPELTPWEQYIDPGQDWRNNSWPGKPNGWYSGTVTFTAFGEIQPEPNADFDGNGTVDGDDLDVWKTGYGLTGSATRAQGDANEDLDVDGNDFLSWQRQLGNSSALGLGSIDAYSNVNGVPEPTGLGLAGILSLLLLTKRMKTDLS